MSEAPEPDEGLIAAPPRGRRADAVTEERRRRKGPGLDPTLARFGITPDLIDEKKYVYRAALDTGMRLHQLTENDDYDFVTDKGEGARTSKAAGVLRYLSGTVDGRPQYSYLLRKLKKFADEDRAERIRNVDAQERQRLTKTPEDAPDKSYTPRS